MVWQGRHVHSPFLIRSCAPALCKHRYIVPMDCVEKFTVKFRPLYISFILVSHPPPTCLCSTCLLWPLSPFLRMCSCQTHAIMLLCVQSCFSTAGLYGCVGWVELSVYCKTARSCLLPWNIGSLTPNFIASVAPWVQEPNWELEDPFAGTRTNVILSTVIGTWQMSFSCLTSFWTSRCRKLERIDNWSHFLDE